MRGKPWSIEEERLLRQLVEEGKSFNGISKIMGKSRVSVKNKLYNLELSLKDNTYQQNGAVSSLSSKIAIINETPIVDPVNDEVALELKATGPLPSVEQKLRVLDAAMNALEQPGLRAAEVLRLRTIIQAVKVYQPLYADFVHYRALEDEVVELRKQLAVQKQQK